MDITKERSATAAQETLSNKLLRRNRSMDAESLFEIAGPIHVNKTSHFVGL